MEQPASVLAPYNIQVHGISSLDAQFFHCSGGYYNSLIPVRRRSSWRLAIYRRDILQVIHVVSRHDLEIIQHGVESSTLVIQTFGDHKRMTARQGSNVKEGVTDNIIGYEHTV